MNRIRSLALAGALVVAAAALAESASAQAAPATPATPAAAPQQQGSGNTERRREPRRRRDVITRDELMESGATNLYDAVDRLRPQWMRARGATNLGGSAGTAVVVYQGNTQLGGLDALRSITLEFAEELRFLDSSQASNTLPGLGSRAVAGAIVIVRPGTTR
jgi:hypothetical protein